MPEVDYFCCRFNWEPSWIGLVSIDSFLFAQLRPFRRHFICHFNLTFIYFHWLPSYDCSKTDFLWFSWNIITSLFRRMFFCLICYSVSFKILNLFAYRTIEFNCRKLSLRRWSLSIVILICAHRQRLHWLSSSHLPHLPLLIEWMVWRVTKKIVWVMKYHNLCSKENKKKFCKLMTAIDDTRLIWSHAKSHSQFHQFMVDHFQSFLSAVSFFRLFCIDFRGSGHDI